jgi:hypothetical protein
MKKWIKVRFNLSAGKNYMKWKIEYPDRKPEYHNPDDIQLMMFECVLKNHHKTAQKIHDGAHKTVCAWVLCKAISIKDNEFIAVDDAKRLKYNPKVSPNWMLNDNNADNMTASRVVSLGNKLFVN